MNDDLTRQLLERVHELERRLGIQETVEFSATHTHAAYVALTGAQTIAGVKTFSSGIAFANETLSVYDEGTWTPVITGSTGDPTVAYTSRTGTYTRIGKIIFYHFFIIISTISGGSGVARVSLPLAAVSGPYGNGYTYNVDLPGTPINVVFVPAAAAAYGNYTVLQDNNVAVNLEISGLAAGDWLGASGFYFV